ANGKVDRRQLPAPEDFGLSSGTTYIPARNNIEAQLIAIWEQVLGRTPVGVKDNFFDLGGHSLKATRLGSLIHKAFDVKLPLKDLFSNSILEQQGVLIAASRKTIFSQIAPAPEQASYPLSSSQRRLWVLSQFEEGSVAYNMPGVYTLTGALDIARLEAAFKTLIARHEILRTVFKEEESGVGQYILATIDFKIEDLTDISAFCYTPFDLSAGPLLRAAVTEVSAGEWVFVYVMHHIISDGWSMGVLIKELLHIYHDNSPLPVLPLQYKDYAVWQQSGSAAMSQAYWLEQFSGELPVLELPADKPRPAVKTYHGGLVQKQLALTGLQSLVQSTGSTLFMGLVAAVNALLYRYSGQEDIILGSPVAGREHADLEGQIGFYVNTLALRTRFSGSNSYLQLLEQVREVTMSAYEHQSYPFDELVDALPLKRDMSRSPLFDVMVVLQETDINELIAQSSGTLQIKPYEEAIDPVSKFDLSFEFVTAGTQLQLSIIYNSDIYEAVTVDAMAAHLDQLLAAITAHPDTAIQQLDYLRKEEKTQLLYDFNNTTAAYPEEKTLVHLFAEQVAKAPDAIALVFEEKIFTYQQLDEHSSQLAHYLRSKYDIKEDDLIGVQLERSERMIIALLAVLKSGGAYVPIDPDFPQDRIDYIVADSACKVLIDEAELLR
ncbi:condensation domain-containing protein, partial [Chitinophaga sp. Cy-1792]|uniref:condensation domain-containing protein n=1 Tax=Chitinophaga sp. Cy-1792 TaxID=2608339 RepID=UPI001421E91A